MPLARLDLIMMLKLKVSLNISNFPVKNRWKYQSLIAVSILLENMIFHLVKNSIRLKTINSSLFVPVFVSHSLLISYPGQSPVFPRGDGQEEVRVSQKGTEEKTYRQTGRHCDL